MRNLLLTTIAILFSTLICFPNYASASHRKGISISPVNPPVESLSTVNLKTNDLIEKYTSYSREYPILISQSEDVRERYLYTKNHVWIDEIYSGRYYVGSTYSLIKLVGDVTFVDYLGSEDGAEYRLGI